MRCGSSTCAWRRRCGAGREGVRANELAHTTMGVHSFPRLIQRVHRLLSRSCAQEGDPDFLSIEILMDACGRAGRLDLLHGYLWKEVHRLNMVVR